MNSELTWYITRASGLVAWVLLVVAAVWGLLLASRVLERRPSSAWLLDMHRHLGWLTLVLTGVHVIALWLDDFVEFTVVELVVPFASDFEKGAVSLGVISVQLLVIVQLTSWARARLPLRLWRAVHWLSGPLVVLATIHGLWIGTDADHPLVIVVGLVVVVELVLVVAVRLAGRPRGPAMA